eukprot:m.391335 g.391335  ORF g.391335 m.391335 type:complete len:675 (+) comp56346_c0_seq6:18-2042(+)
MRLWLLLTVVWAVCGEQLVQQTCDDPAPHPPPPPPLTCKELKREAQAKTASNDLAAAGQLLRTCAELEPTADNLWQAGMALSKTNMLDALELLQQSLALHVDNPGQHAAFGMAAHQAGNYMKAILGFEAYLESAMDFKKGDWQRELRQIAKSAVSSRRAVSDFEQRMSPQFKHTLLILLNSYTQSSQTQPEGDMHIIVTRLFPQENQFHTNYYSYLARTGNALEAAKEANRFRAGAHGEAKATLSGVIAFALALESNALHVLKFVMTTATKSARQLLLENCKEDVRDLVNLQTLPAQRFRDIFSKCALSQNVFKSLAKGGLVRTRSHYDSDPLHLLAQFGHHQLFSEFRKMRGVDVTTTNSLGQTNLHIATSRYNYDIILELLEVPGLEDVLDMYGRTAFEYACLHRFFFTFAPPDFPWSATDCDVSTKAIQEKRTTPFVRKPSGWRQETHAEATCDFDIRSDLSADEFMRQYLSVQRPVLVRNHHRKNAKWESLRKNWKRESFLQKYGSVSATHAEIPYAREFGVRANDTTLRDYAEHMYEPRAAPPTYVFEEPNEALSQSFILPRLVDQPLTSKQFYLGPKNSGAPMHFHSGALNTLVYGRKDWYITPPAVSVYSREPPTTWLANMRSAKEPTHLVHCVQEETDVLYVPAWWGHAVINAEDAIGYANEFEAA